jgi:hypothetical protein
MIIISYHLIRNLALFRTDTKKKWSWSFVYVKFYLLYIGDGKTKDCELLSLFLPSEEQNLNERNN